VNAILEAISNSVSVMPAAALSAQPVSVQRGLGGFALTLAAAQGISTASRMAASEVEASEGLVEEGAGATTNLNMRVLVTGIPQTKKLPNSSSPHTVSTLDAGNVVVPGFVPIAASLQPSIPATRATAAPVQTPGIAIGTVWSGLQTTVYDAAGQSTDFVYSALSRTAGIVDPLTSLDGGAGTGGLTDLSTSGVLIPNEISGQANGQEISMSDNAAPPVLSTTEKAASIAVLPTSSRASQGDASEDELASREPLPASTQPPSPVLLDFAEHNQGSSLSASGSGLESGESIPQADQSLASTSPAPILAASAIPEAEPGAEVLASSAANLETGQTNSANATAPDVVDRADGSAETGTQTLLPEILPGQISTLSILNPATQLGQGGASPWLAAARATAAVAMTNPSVRGAGAGAGVPAPTLASVLSAGSDSSNGSPMAGLTPFSVFFSGAESGTESAAAALPKMILPVTSSAIRDSHTSAAGAASVTPQTSGLENGASQSRTSQSSTAQNAAGPNTKDSLTGVGSGSSQGGQASRRDADTSAASVQVVSSPTAAAPIPAPPTSAAAALPFSGPAAPVADPLAKPDASPSAASGNPASPVPVSADTPAAAVPGPVQVAQLVNRIGQSEMRVGMNTSAFGNVEVRTVVHASDVGLVIGSEKGDLRTLLANEMPAITNTLQQQNLRLNSVNLMQGFAFSNSSSGGGDSQPRSFVPMRASASSVVSGAAMDDSMEPLPVAEFSGGSGSLSILA
jgi:hypothetical protein